MSFLYKPFPISGFGAGNADENRLVVDISISTKTYIVLTGSNVLYFWREEVILMKNACVTKVSFLQ